MKFLRDMWLLFVRNLMGTLRNPVWVAMGLFQPVLYLLLFAPLLKNLSIPGFGQASALNIFTPGMLVMLALFGTGYAGFAVIADLRAGVIERLRVTPASRVALLLGMVMRDVVVLSVQGVLLVVVASIMGLRADLVGLLLMFALIALLGLMVGSFSYALGMITKEEGALSATLSAVLLPLQLLSGIMLPLTLAPVWMQTVANFTPFSHAVDAGRALVNGHFGDSAIMLGFSITIVLTILAVFWAARVFRHATA